MTLRIFTSVPSARAQPVFIDLPAFVGPLLQLESCARDRLGALVGSGWMNPRARRMSRDIVHRCLGSSFTVWLRLVVGVESR